jgi:transcriptional regulator with XRE-family HTH domain
MNKIVKLLLFQSGHSIYSLRRVTGTLQVTVWELLSGVRQKPNPEYVEKIAHALGISPEELLQLTRLSDNKITPEVLHKVIFSSVSNQNDIAQVQKDEQKFNLLSKNYDCLHITQKRRVCKWKLQKRN